MLWFYAFLQRLTEHLIFLNFKSFDEVNILKIYSFFYHHLLPSLLNSSALSIMLFHTPLFWFMPVIQQFKTKSYLYALTC